MAVYLDTLTVGPADAPNLTPRGTVLALDGIKGSARSTAAVQLSSSLPMTDWLVASIDGTEGDPLLAVTASACTGAGYDGVYSVIAALSPSAAPVNPTLTITQRIAGLAAASRTLTGVMADGNRYISYGAVELPLVGVPVENTAVTYDFVLGPAMTQYADLLVIDVDAAMVWVPNQSPARRYAWIDEPDPTSGLGRVWVGDAADRSDARAPSAAPVPLRPIHVVTPSVRLLGYSTAGAPSATADYLPSFLAEPTS